MSRGGRKQSTINSEQLTINGRGKGELMGYNEGRGEQLTINNQQLTINEKLGGLG